MKECGPTSVGNNIDEVFTEMVLKSAERLMYAAEGVRVAVMGHTMDGFAA